jgi:hypothetical protein
MVGIYPFEGMFTRIETLSIDAQRIEYRKAYREKKVDSDTIRQDFMLKCREMGKDWSCGIIPTSSVMESIWSGEILFVSISFIHRGEV